MDTKNNKSAKSRIGCLQVLGLLAAVILIGFLLGAWWVKYNIYASEFSPTKLSTKEQKVLDKKLARLEDSSRDRLVEKPSKKHETLSPEPYTEEGAEREIKLSEKELNGLIANTPDLAKKVALDLSDNLVSLKLIVPMDEDIIFLGGKTLRLNMGVILKYEQEQLVVALKGVSLGGIPVPNAWLGHLKNKNLVEEFGDEGGFWALFAEGVENIMVREGHIQIKLKE